MERYRVWYLIACAMLVSCMGIVHPAAAQTVKPGGSETITIRGILSGTLYAQDAFFSLGNGQRALFVTQRTDSWFHAGDVRNTRIGLDFNGPTLFGKWSARGTIEIDFFGGYNGAGAFGDEQPLPRLRLAFADLTNGRTTLRIGQDWSLLLGNIPVSTSHLAFPLGWSSGGFIGWRFPGISFRQVLTDSAAKTTAELQLGAFQGSWSDPISADFPSDGQDAIPQLEAKLIFRGKAGQKGTWNAYVVGHYNQINLNGVRLDTARVLPPNNMNSWAGEVGAAVVLPKWTLHGNAYTGKAMAHQFASILQFGDIRGWGAWGQAGYTFAPRWSLWAFYGTDNPDDDDVIASTPNLLNNRLRSWVVVPMLRFQAGPYQLGLEWLHNEVRYAQRSPLQPFNREGNQILASVLYNF